MRVIQCTGIDTFWIHVPGRFFIGTYIVRTSGMVVLKLGQNRELIYKRIVRAPTRFHNKHTSGVFRPY